MAGNPSSFLGQVAQTFGVRLAGIVMAIPTSVFLARGLTPAMRGEYTLILTSVAVASLFTGMGLAPANVRFAAKYPEIRGALLGNSILYSLVIGALAFLVLIPLGGLFSLTITSSAVISLLISMTLFSGYAANILLGSQLIIKYNIAQIVEYISRFAAFLAAFLLFHGIWGYIFAYTSSIVLKCVYVLFALRSTISVSRPSVKILFRQIRFGLPLHLSTVLRRLNKSITIYLLRFFSGDAAVGYLAIPQNYLVRAKILPRTVASLLLPRVAASDDESLAEQTAKLLRMMFAFFLLVALLIFPVIPSLFTLLYGVDYQPAIPAAQIIIFAFPFFSFSQVSSNYLVGRGNSRFFLRLSIYSFGTGVTTLLLCVPPWGLIGAALAVVTMELASFIYCLIAMRKLGRFTLGQMLIPVPADIRFLIERLRRVMKRSGTTEQ